MLIYALDRIKAKVIKDTLEVYRELENATHVQSVTDLGVGHAMFWDDSALLFHEAVDCPHPSGAIVDYRLLFLESGSWLLWQRQVGGFGGEIPSIEPSTSHHHTAELLPVFTQMGFEGPCAVTAMRSLFGTITPLKRWSTKLGHVPLASHPDLPRACVRRITTIASDRSMTRGAGNSNVWYNVGVMPR